MIYIPRQIGENKYEIATFEESKEPKSVYVVIQRPRSWTCDCPGFYRQHDKTKHKHILTVQCWIEDCEKEPGWAFEYNEDLDLIIPYQFMDWSIDYE